jgi:hypothetical protein
LPGEGEYDRGERKQLRGDVKAVFAGCGIVVGIIVLTYVAYAAMLFLSGWQGR